MSSPFTPYTKSKTQGTFLIETLVGLFILVSAFTVVLTLYSRSVGYQNNTDNKLQAARFAKKVQADLAVTALDYNFFFNGDWSAFSNVTDPTFPELEARVQVLDGDTLLPCGEFEKRHPDSDRVTLTQSLKKASVKVYRNGNLIWDVTSFLSEPKAPIAPTEPVKLNLLSGSIAGLSRDGEVEYEAHLYDSSGREIPEVQFQWSVVPISGNATVESVSRNTESAQMKNVFRLSDGSILYTGGSVKLQATARYYGELYSGESEEITLDK